jgi:hypothetical protein
VKGKTITFFYSVKGIGRVELKSKLKLKSKQVHNYNIFELFCVALKSYHDFYERLIKAWFLAGRVRRVPERELQVAAVRGQLIKKVRSKFVVEMIFSIFAKKIWQNFYSTYYLL